MAIFTRAVLTLLLLLLTTTLTAPTTAFMTTNSVLKLRNISSRTLKDWQVRLLNVVLERRLRFQRLLAGLHTSSDCVAQRDRAIAQANMHLQRARDCKYNGLPFATYERKRDSCFMRAALREKSDRLSAKCGRLPAAEKYACDAEFEQLALRLLAVQKDCEDIGRPRLGVLPDCPDLLPLKQQLATVSAQTCEQGAGESALSEDELKGLIKKADDRLDELLNGRAAPASNDPRFPINF